MTTAPKLPPNDGAPAEPVPGPNSTTPPPTSFTPRQTRRIVLISGIVAVLFSVYLLAFLVPDTLKSLAGPEQLSVTRAAETAGSDTTYVEIDGGVWHCDTIEYIKGRSSSGNRFTIITRNTEIFLTDEANLPDVVVLVTESGEKSCEDFQNTTLDGYLKRMSSSTQQELANEVRLAQFPGATTYLEVCAYCGPQNSMIGVGFGLVVAVGGVALVVWGRRIRVDQDETAED